MSVSTVAHPPTRLDELVPTWQFSELHSRLVAAPPERVYAAMKGVRASEIFLFRALTWIRRGGRPLPLGILNAGDRDPLIAVALRGEFILLADEPPREFVMGTVIRRPRGAHAVVGPGLFLRTPPGFTVAALNFVVNVRGASGSIISTETRVFANGADARRRFALYWLLIYPGSSLIRRMWLRAIAKRATRAE